MEVNAVLTKFSTVELTQFSGVEKVWLSWQSSVAMAKLSRAAKVE